MIITNDILDNLVIKEGKLSEKRRMEINAMKIRNPYYVNTTGPTGFTRGEFFELRERDWATYSEDEKIVYEDYAFGPTGFGICNGYSSCPNYDLLFIENTYFMLVFDLLNRENINRNGMTEIITTEKLRDNEELDRRSDKKEIIYLLQRLRTVDYLWGFRTMGKEIDKLNIEYEGELYKWRN